MARTKYEFIKVELRLFNDYRFFSLNEFERLVYVSLLAFAKQTKNKIPKQEKMLLKEGDPEARQDKKVPFFEGRQSAIKSYLRTNRSEGEIHSAIKQIKKSFPKFKETKYFYHFDDYEERYSYGTEIGTELYEKGGIDKDKEKEIDKEIDIDQGKPKKHKYGEFKNVLLSDEEYKKLQERFNGNADEWVTKLDEGIEYKGYKYKSHYLAVLKWAEKEQKQAKSTSRRCIFRGHEDKPCYLDCKDCDYAKKQISNKGDI